MESRRCATLCRFQTFSGVPHRYEVPEAAQTECTRVFQAFLVMHANGRADNADMSISASMMKRIVVAASLLMAFLFMASIFSPDRSNADDDLRIVDPTSVSDAQAWPSTDPHAGLRSLGTFESVNFHVRVYATESGPRYSIYSARDQKELGVLMSATQVTRTFPELQLPGVKFEAAPRQNDIDQLMLAEPDQVMLDQ
jgi:hypothetical protein